MSQIDFERGVALSIDIKIADHCQLIFKNATKELKVESKFSRYQLKAERDALRQGLDEFQSGFAALRRRPLPEVGKALGLLHLLGRKILYRLFDDKEKLNEAQQMCWDACPNRRQPGWEQPGRDPASLPPHVIEVRTAVDHGIPIDLLPLLDPMKPRPVERELCWVFPVL